MHIFTLFNNFVTTLLVVSQPVSACIVDNTPFCKKIMKNKYSSGVTFTRNKPKFRQVKINKFIIVM